MHSTEEEKENMKEEYFNTKQQIEERQTLLRQELVKTQQTLSNTEMEVEQLRKDLQLQIKNKQKLVSWKVKNAQLLEQLEEKVDKYERWNQYDVDKLILELDKKKTELKKLSGLEQKMSRKADIIEQKSAKKLEEVTKKLKREQMLKESAFGKLTIIRTDQEVQIDTTLWQKKYFDAMAELQIALREIDVLKVNLDKAGVEVQSISDMNTSTTTTQRNLHSSHSERLALDSRPPTRPSSSKSRPSSVHNHVLSTTPTSFMSNSLIPPLRVNSDASTIDMHHFAQQRATPSDMNDDSPRSVSTKSIVPTYRANKQLTPKRPTTQHAARTNGKPSALLSRRASSASIKRSTLQ